MLAYINKIIMKNSNDLNRLAVFTIKDLEVLEVRF